MMTRQPIKLATRIRERGKIRRDRLVAEARKTRHRRARLQGRVSKMASGF
jgi:hypothetical protein